jgi:hypothetical protein
MKRKVFGILVTVILFTTAIPIMQSVESKAINEKTIVRVITSTGEIQEKHLSPLMAIQLESMMNTLQEDPDKYQSLLPDLLKRLEKYGLIEDAGSMEHTISKRIQYFSKQAHSPDISLFFNIACFVIGYGNSFLVTPAMLLSVMLLPLSFIILLYQDIHPRISVPIGGWFINTGMIQTLGILGPKSYTRGVSNAVPPPALVLVFGFTGLWISFLIKGIEHECFVGSAVAVFGG